MTVMGASRLGIGLAAVGRPAYITAGRERDLGDHRSVDDLRARTEAVLDAAYAAGIRYIDTARSYGRAEEFLAGWLRSRPHVGDVVIGSKWGYRYVGNWRRDADVHEIKDHSPAAFTEQLAQTRELLGEALQVYHVHSATLDTGALSDVALHRVLADLRDEGVRIGIDQLAIAAALAQPWASRVLSGAVSPAQVASNAAAAALALPDDVVADLGTLAEHSGVYWATRSRRAWR